MSQTILYWVEDDGESTLSEEEWAEIEHLQRKTNFLEYLNRGRVGVFRFTYAPRWPQLYSDSMLPEGLSMEETERHLENLIEKGWSWEDLVHARLAARLPGGLYASDCLLAGRSEVSDLRGDVKLVVRFVLRASTLAPSATFHVAIDGNVRVPELPIRNGDIRPDNQALGERLKALQASGDEDAAADLLEAAESGDFLGPGRRTGSVGA